MECRQKKTLILFFMFLIFFIQFVFGREENSAVLKSEIYSKLRDRRCTTMTLDKCDCPDAREMKAYIEALIETGMGKDEIFYKVAKKFSLNTILDKKIKQDVEMRLVNEAGTKRPQIVLEPTNFNFAKVSKKEGKVSKIFKLHNRGNADLIITSVRVSCTCTTASLKVGKEKSPDFGVSGSPSGWQAVIEPRESAELEVVLDLAHSSMVVGKQMRDIFIVSNDPIYSQVTLRVEAEVSD